MAMHGRRARRLGSSRKLQPRHKMVAAVASHPNSSIKEDGLSSIGEHHSYSSRREPVLHRLKTEPSRRLPILFRDEPSPHAIGSTVEATSTPTRRAHSNSTGEKNFRVDRNIQDHGIGAGGGMQVKMMREEQRAEQSRVMERELSHKVGDLLVKGRVQRRAHELMASHSVR